MKLYACRKKNSIDWGFYIKMYIYLCCIDKKNNYLNIATGLL